MKTSEVFLSRLRLPLGTVGAACLLALTTLGYREDPQTELIHSGRLRLEIDSGHGGVKRINNDLTGDSKNVRSIAFRLLTTRGELLPGMCRLLEFRQSDDGMIFRFSGQGMQIDVRYEATPQADAVRKSLTVTNLEEEELTLLEIVVFEWVVPGDWPEGYRHSYYPQGINQIHFHRSGFWYDAPVNLFLRDESGGLFLGIENPFFEARYRALRKVYPASVELSYQPRWRLAEGDSFQADAGFVGAYRQEKIYALRPPDPYFDARQRARLEVLDWGEVWAMQRYMEAIMPPSQAPGGGYYMAYWGKADPGRLGRASEKKNAGQKLDLEEQAMLEHFGGGPFSFHPLELWHRLTLDTVRFYKKVIDDAAFLGHYHTIVIPNMMAGHSGWFESVEQQGDRRRVQDLTDSWFQEPAFALWRQIADYARQKGLGMFLLELAGREYRRDRPDWKYVKASEERTRINCFANRDYVDWYTARLEKALSTHPISHLQWDEGWMDVLLGHIGEDAYCYAENHGHLPGNVSYQQYRYVLETLGTLKRRHPEVRLMIISGLIRGMPWIMKYLDGDSHTGAIENAAWVDRNVYFLPAYKSHREGSIHWIVERGSAGAEPNPAEEWYTILSDPQRRNSYREKRDYWMNWAAERLEYLQRRRDLFFSRGESELRGTAHVKEGHGYAFLNNSGTDLAAGEIPLNSWLGLEDGDRFEVIGLYPERRPIGIYERNETVVLTVGPGETVLIEISATRKAADRPETRIPENVVVQKAFFELNEVFELLKAEDFWPAAPLAGQGNMRSF